MVLMMSDRGRNEKTRSRGYRINLNGIFMIAFLYPYTSPETFRGRLRLAVHFWYLFGWLQPLAHWPFSSNEPRTNCGSNGVHCSLDQFLFPPMQNTILFGPDTTRGERYGGHIRTGPKQRTRYLYIFICINVCYKCITFRPSAAHTHTIFIYHCASHFQFHFESEPLTLLIKIYYKNNNIISFHTKRKPTHIRK